MRNSLRQLLIDHHPLSVEAIKLIDAVFRKMGFPCVLIGAQARDLILVGKYGLHSGSATKDIDFAVMVDGWGDFELLKKELLAQGLKQIDGIEHRFSYKETCQLDIVPFGGIEEDGHITWPTDNETKMSVVGFTEMFEHSETLIVDEDLSIKVASLAGLCIIKLMAWNDRKHANAKDGEDFALIMKNYTDAGNFDRIYESVDKDIIAACDYDIELAGAQLLGRDVAEIARKSAIDSLISIIDMELKGDDELLIQTMCSYFTGDYDRTREMLTRFKCELT